MCPQQFEGVVLDCQSGDATTADNSLFKVSLDTNYENVDFHDQMSPYMYDIEEHVDSTRKMQDTTDTSLENFFRRPIKIAEQEWSTSANLNFDIDPWSLYLDNARVSNRLTNYNLLRCNLHVKVIINGNGFQYGRMLVSYLPNFANDNLTTMAALVQSDLVQASQMPHIFLDPTTSLGGEMKLPFFYWRNYLNIPNSDWSRLGQLFFRTLNPLKHANGATDVVTVSVFAWAEDVEVSVLTSVDTDTLTPQSGEIDEANEDGVVSGPATAVSKYASYLKNVPIIAPYATATETGANAIASMARLFGYCRPPITKCPDPYRPTPISSLALTNVPDNAQKMTIDDKQELSIDPRIAGIGPADPLNIREIAKRESYLTTFSWNIGTAPETILWNSRVTPLIWAEDTGPPVSFHFPACALATIPFQYWKGSMKFRFQIVCSSFHKGRIKVVYDPNFIDANEYNTNYLRIVDIAQEQDFTVEVGMGQDTSYLSHFYPGLDGVTELYSTTKYTSRGSPANGEGHNGTLAVYIVNELTTPNSTVNNDIEINVFVSMGDDFEVAAPEDYLANFVLQPQSGTLVPESQDTSEPSAPQQANTLQLGLPVAEDMNLNKVFFGEAISSFRTLLKRYTVWNAIGKIDNTGSVISRGRYCNIPYQRGNVAGAVDLTALAAPYNYCNTLLLHWLLAAFSGYRGSTRWKLVPRGNANRGDIIKVQRVPYVITKNVYTEAWGDVLPSYTSAANLREQLVSDNTKLNNEYTMRGQNGQVYTLNSVNGVLEFETPYYSNNRFSPGKSQSYSRNSTGMVFDAAWDYEIEFTSNATQATSWYEVHSAIGEDFQFYFFTGLPRMYFEGSPPAA